MQNGNLADAQLRALIDVAAVAAGAYRLEEVLELAADDRSRRSTRVASISRWYAESGILQTLVNVGDLARRSASRHETTPSRTPRAPADGERELASRVDDPTATRRRALLSSREGGQPRCRCS